MKKYGSCAVLLQKLQYQTPALDSITAVTPSVSKGTSQISEPASNSPSLPATDDGAAEPTQSSVEMSSAEDTAEEERDSSSSNHGNSSSEEAGEIYIILVNCHPNYIPV